MNADTLAEIAGSIRDGLAGAIVEEGRSKPAPPSTYGKARASMIGSECLRQIQYAAYETPSEEMGIDGEYVTQVGGFLEDLFESWLARLPKFELFDKAELAPDRDVPWTATPDRVLRHKHTGHLVGVELKAMNTYRYVETHKNGIFAAHSGYWWQVQAQVLRYPQLAAGVLVAFPMDYSGVKGKSRKEKLPPFYVEAIEPTERSRAILTETGTTIAEAGEPTGLLLPRGYKIGKDWQCDYCAWRTQCELDGESEEI